MQQPNRVGRSGGSAATPVALGYRLESLEPRRLLTGIGLPCAGITTAAVSGESSIHVRMVASLEHPATSARSELNRLLPITNGRLLHGRSHGKGSPSLTHPGGGDGRGQPGQSRGGASSGQGGVSDQHGTGPLEDNSATTGAGGSLGGPVEVSAGILFPSAVGPEELSPGAPVVDVPGSSSAPQVTADGQSAMTAYAESVEPVVRGLTRPALTATFSVLPLALKELQIALRGTTGVAQSAARSFARPADLHGTVVEPVENGIAAAAASTRTVMVNLFHVDALATFRDAIGSFIDDSAASAVRHPPGHRRAWTITAAVLAADVALMAYWFAAREVQASDQGESADHPRSRLSLGMAALQR